MYTAWFNDSSIVMAARTASFDLMQTSLSLFKPAVVGE